MGETVRPVRSIGALLGVGTVLCTVLVGTGSAYAAPARPSGGGGASATVVNLAEAAKAKDPRFQPVRPKVAPHTATATLPSRPSTGARPGTRTGALRPFAAPAVAANFDGINQATGCGSCQPPDPNSATSGSEIVELVNTFIQVTDNVGTVLCNGGVTLNRLLRSTDSLTDPRVQFDNVNRRFSLSVSIEPASTSATPAMYVAASDTADACGTWRVYRLTFNGSPFPAGTFLDFPMLGQDTNALLVSTRNFTPSNGVNFTVYGLPKATVYAGNPVSFSTFGVASLTAPVSNAGTPMIASPFSYFLAAVPGTGYRLYRLSNSGGPGASITLQATISATFSAPTRRANQPGTTVTLDPSDGNILWSPVYDGTSIWFAHDVDLSGFPTVRYGAVNVTNNTVATAFGFHSGTSDDFDASIGIGLGPAGETVFVTWAYTDAPNGVATSNTVDTVAPGGGIPNLIGTGTVLVNGSSTTETRFGDYNSVSVDPSVSTGTCAVVTNQYFAAGGAWRTRVARVGNCAPQPLVSVPDLGGDTPGQAGSELSSVGLFLAGTVGVTDNTCNNLGTVLNQNPRPGTQVSPGTGVTIFVGQPPPPPQQCP